MIRSTPPRRLRRSVPAALLAALLAAGILPGSGLAGARTAATTSPSATPADSDRSAATASTTTSPSTVYEAWLAHQSDAIDFTPGARVTVGFAPRSTDSWPIGGRPPTALPAAGPAVITPASVVAPRSTASGSTSSTATTTGLRRQVFGFLPYWELSGASTSLNYSVLTTIAYFSVGADTAGNLKKRNANGSLTTGWGGWTSSAMTSVINAAHAHGTRVVLTASVFAWTSSTASAQAALLGSSTARANFATQLVAAVRDRGADGVNLDFEPLVSGQEAHFVALVKTLRAKFNAIHAGYQITFDTTGFIGNYPIESLVGPAVADAVFIMGYDYQTASSSTSGSVDPLYGPDYDLTDTIREYTARIRPSQVILGVPWYGRVWSTASASPRAANISGAKFGESTAVNYENIPALVAKYGRHWDAVEASPFIAYQRQNCTTTYGCVTSWRQVWYDDATSLGQRYQLVSDYGLRGAGIWALGYDGSYADMVRALTDAFLVDHAAPDAGIRALSTKSPDEGIVVAWAASDVSAVRTYDVQVSIDGRAWTPWLTGVTETTDVYPGVDGHGYAFRVRATDAKGNAGSWNVTASGSARPSSLAVGGFGRVTLGGLAYRSGPDTSAARLGSLPTGTVVALTAGPVSADGYTWYEVTQPIKEWSPVSFVERGVWIAAKSSTATNVIPFHAPNSTVVDAGITGFDFGGGGLTGTSATAIAGRRLSPNADGVRDGIRVRWTATVGFSSLALNVLRPDGSLLGSVPVTPLTTGTHGFTWNGRVGGKRVADGTYALQLIGFAGTKSYRAPSALPSAASQIARFAVVVDTVPPTVASASASSKLLSPNADGTRATATFALAANGATGWNVSIAASAGASSGSSSPATPPSPVRAASGSGAKLAFSWDGRDQAGTLVPDGVYVVTLAACDAAGNCATKTYSIRVDATPPTVTPTAAPGLFSPNGDGAADRASLRWTASEPSSGTAAVWHGTTLVRRWTVASATAGAVVWDGRTAAGSAVPDGRYTLKVDVRDAAGNRTVAAAPVVVDRTTGALRWSGGFFPQDGDTLAPTARLSWQMTRTASTSLALYDSAGHLVRTVWSGRTKAAGLRTWTWNGKLADGSFAPQGLYQARLTVTSTLGTQTLVKNVWASAFATTLSATTVRAGGRLTVTFATTEALRTRPVVAFRQPGVTSVTITATRLADGRYRAQFTIRAGAAGVATVRIAATDAGGHANLTTRAVAVVL